jgi:predicted nucleic acid-binding protein
MAGPFSIDASVFLNAFISSEKGSKVSKELLTRLQTQAIPLISPYLLLPETAAAISRGQNNPELARQFAVNLGHLPHLVLISRDKGLAQQALDIAALYWLRGRDAAYAAISQRFACPLITLDKEQHDRVTAVVKTFYPEEILTILKKTPKALRLSSTIGPYTKSANDRLSGYGGPAKRLDQSHSSLRSL